LLKEMGLGLVLMLAGDGEMARRAGDALIADKVQDAIEEGGFESVEYDSWDKGFDGGRFWVGFDDVRVRRDGASLGARVAVIYPMSVLMDFERGKVRLGPEGGAWRFASVRISGAYSLFSRGLTVEGTNLRHEGRSGDPGGFGEAECLFADACGYGYPLDPSGLERFRLAMERSGRSASLLFTWRVRNLCHEIRADRVEVERGAALSEIGSGLVNNRYDAAVELASGPCEDAAEGEADGSALAEGARIHASTWQARDRSLDEILQILMVSVPEAYEYLVE
jgi:hypothetical protein